MTILNKELALEWGHRIQTEAQSEMEKTQREYFLREQLKAIQRELGEGDEQLSRLRSFGRRPRRRGCRRTAREARRERQPYGPAPAAAG